MLKFLAGPLVDASLMRGARLRTWILASQSAMVISLATVAFVDWPNELTLLTVLLVAHALCAATQDVAIDTLAIRVVPASELGGINGWMQAGMLTGRALVAAGTVAMAGTFGPAAPIIGVSLVVALPMLLVMRATPELPVVDSAIPPIRAWFAALSGRQCAARRWHRVNCRRGFRVLVGRHWPPAGDGGRHGRSGVDLLWRDGSGWPRGRCAVQWPGHGSRGAVARYGSLASSPSRCWLVRLAAPWRPAVDPIAAVLLVAVSIIYVAIGFFTTASYALFMRLARGELAATRFAVFMAMTNACEAWAGFAGGRLQGEIGYG